MNAAEEPELHHVEDSLHLSGGLLDIEIPIASVNDLLCDSQLTVPWFDFSNLEPRDLSPKPQADMSSSSGSVSDNSAPSLITSHNSISPQPAANGPQQEPPCRNPQGLCIHLATRVLSSMHVGSSSCVLSTINQEGGHRPQVGADAALSVSQSALAAIRHILPCSCSGVPQVLLLVTAICSQIGASYRKVADIYSQRGRANTNSGVKLEGQRREFFIGNHRLSPEVEAAVVREVLLGMLRELEVIIGDISCHAIHSSAGNDLSGVRVRMAEFLRTQVRVLNSGLDHLGSHDMSGLSAIPPY